MKLQYYLGLAAFGSLGDIDEARRLAALVAGDERFGERARDLLSSER